MGRGDLLETRVTLGKKTRTVTITSKQRNSNNNGKSNNKNKSFGCALHKHTHTIELLRSTRKVTKERGHAPCGK